MFIGQMDVCIRLVVAIGKRHAAVRSMIGILSDSAVDTAQHHFIKQSIGATAQSRRVVVRAA